MSRSASDTPRALEQIIFQLLEKDPERRFRSASALSKSLAAMEHALTLRGEEEEDDLKLAEPSSPEQPDVTQIASDHPVKVPTGPTVVPPSPDVSSPAQATHMDRDDHVALTDHSKPTNTRSTSAGRTDHFTVVEPAPPNSDDSSWQNEPAQASSWFPTALAVLALLLVVATLVVMFRPPSADQLYGRIASAAEKAESEEDRRSLVDVENDVQQFLMLYGDDPRVDEVRQQQGEIKQAKLARSLQRQSRGFGSGSDLSPAGRAYRDALALEKSAPDEAVERLRAIVAVFGSVRPSPNDNTSEVVDLAKRQLERLGPIADAIEKKQREAIAAHLDEADRLAATDADQAAAIRRGIVILYGEKSWARDLVERARK